MRPTLLLTLAVTAALLLTPALAAAAPTPPKVRPTVKPIVPPKTTTAPNETKFPAPCTCTVQDGKIIARNRTCPRHLDSNPGDPVVTP